MVEVAQVNVFEVADYFIWLANTTSKQELSLCPLKLQKLIFLAQGWHLAFHDEPLFLEDFEAWSYGPVIRSVYNKYRFWGSQPINRFIEQPDLPFDIEYFLKKVFSTFLHTSALKLSSMTHEDGTPWSKVRNGLPLESHCSKIIPKDLIKEYYENLINDTEENGDEENTLDLFLEFLENDAEKNFHKLIPYTEDMFEQDKHLLKNIIDL